MSGGYFDYQQYKLDEWADEIERLIATNKTPDEYGYKRDYSSDAIEEFRQAVKALRRARIYLHRIDYLVCGDDSEDSFLNSLYAELLRDNTTKGRSVVERGNG